MQKTNTEIKNLDQLEKFAQGFAEKIASHKETNLCILMRAAMGAGKTSFTASLGRALGIKARVTSPSFAGMNHYQAAELDLYHYDCYQVKPSLEELLEILDLDSKKVLVFEWAENLDENFLDLLEKKTTVINLEIKVQEDESRVFSFT